LYKGKARKNRKLEETFPNRPDLKTHCRWPSPLRKGESATQKVQAEHWGRVGSGNA